jgi:glucosamine-6-phosphate deaminase
MTSEPLAPLRTFVVDRLQVRTYATRAALGQAAARDVAAAIADCLTRRPEANLVFAAAPSQEEFLAALAAHPAVEWPRVQAFHMDEYVGLAPDAPQRFGTFLSERLFRRVPLRAVYLIDGNAADLAAELDRYTRLLHAHPVDIVCLGIGENGHIAFNDPPVADFADPLSVKRVALDLASRQQQVHDGAFAELAHVPTHALTLTIPALIRAARMFCIVPAPSKARAVLRTLTGPIGTECPATILRRHAAAILYTDRDSAALLPPHLAPGPA